MNTICKIADIDIYLLYYLDIKTILKLLLLSIQQNTLMKNLEFIKQLRIIVQKYGHNNIVDTAARYNYISLMQWLSESINEFKYSSNAIDKAAVNGARERLQFHCNLTRRCGKC